MATKNSNNTIEETILKEVLISQNRKIVEEILHSKYFHNENNQIIFDSILVLYGKNMDFGVDSVISFINDTKMLEKKKTAVLNKIGKLETSHLLYFDDLPKDLKEKHIYSNIRTLGHKLIKAGDGYRITDAMKDIAKTAEEAQSAAAQKEAVRYREVINDYFKNYREDKLPRDYLKFGRRSLHDIFGNIYKGLYVIGGRPGMCKTVVADNIFIDLCEQDQQGLYFSIENMAERTAKNICAIESGVRHEKFQQNKFTEQDLELIQKFSLNPNSGKDHWIYDDAVTVEDIRSKTEFMMRRYPIKFIIIDFFQLINHSFFRLDERMNYQHMTMYLQRMWKELGITIFLLSQVNERDESKKGGFIKFHLGQLKGAGSLEQDADFVVGIGGDRKASERTFYVAKNRFGPLRTREYRFDLTRGAITDKVEEDSSLTPDSYMTQKKKAMISLEDHFNGDTP